MLAVEKCRPNEAGGEANLANRSNLCVTVLSAMLRFMVLFPIKHSLDYCFKVLTLSRPFGGFLGESRTLQVAFKLPPHATPLDKSFSSPLTLTRKRRRSWAVKKRDVYSRGPPKAPHNLEVCLTCAPAQGSLLSERGAPASRVVRGDSTVDNCVGRNVVRGESCGRYGGFPIRERREAGSSRISAQQQAFVVGPISRFTALYFDEEMEFSSDEEDARGGVRGRVRDKGRRVRGRDVTDAASEHNIEGMSLGRGLNIRVDDGSTVDNTHKNQSREERRKGRMIGQKGLAASPAADTGATGATAAGKLTVLGSREKADEQPNDIGARRVTSILEETRRFVCQQRLADQVRRASIDFGHICILYPDSELSNVDADPGMVERIPWVRRVKKYIETQEAVENLKTRRGSWRQRKEEDRMSFRGERFVGYNTKHPVA